MERKTALSFQVSFPLERKYHKNRLVISEKIASSEKAVVFTYNGEAIKVAIKVTPRARDKIHKHNSNIRLKDD